MVVRNMRLKGRDSVNFVEPQFGHLSLPSRIAVATDSPQNRGIPVPAARASAMLICLYSSNSLSARQRFLHSRQSVSGSLNVASCPEYFQTARLRMMLESIP